MSNGRSKRQERSRDIDELKSLGSFNLTAYHTILRFCEIIRHRKSRKTVEISIFKIDQ